MIYYINYELDNGYRTEDIAVVVNSRFILSTDKEIREFLYETVETHPDAIVKRIYSTKELDPKDYTNKLIIRKVGMY